MSSLPPPETPTGSVAVVGMAGRFPGADTPARLWELCAAGRDAITRSVPGTNAPDSARRGSRHVAAAGVLPGIEAFDAGFFGIPTREAERLDPQQRLLLECAWEALADAGCVPGRFDGAIGVFAGVGAVGYGTGETALTDSGTAGDQARLLAVDKDFAATRIAHRLDLHGPAITVQTACSTSLVAVHLGVQSLLAGDSDAVLAGAAAIRLPHHDGYVYQPGGIFAEDGHCRPFSADARGTVPGSGVAMVLLKRLRDALADGDHIYAVVKGSAVNNDGRTKQSFSAPSVTGQLDALTTAHRRAGVDPATIGYVEAHGTATPLGDQIEFAALSRAFHSVPPGGCALGSVKANIGHLDVAAGVTGLMKAALALYHRRIPPALYGGTPHPELRIAESPFRLPATAEPWPATGTPRRAAVSSFGVGGTNAHLVLEEAPPPGPRTSTRRCHLLLLSERDPAALRATAGALATRLPGTPLAAVSSTLVSGRAFQPHRWSRVVVDGRSARHALLRLADPESGEGRGPTTERRAVLVLPEGARLSPRQLRELAREETAFADVLRALAADLRSGEGGTDDRPPVPPGEDPREVALEFLAGLLPDSPVTTAGIRPLPPEAAFAATLALARLLVRWGTDPVGVSGVGTGALAAACLAGILTPAAGALLAGARDEDSVRRVLTGAAPRAPYLPCRSDLTGEDLTAARAVDPEYWVTRSSATTRGHSWLLPGHDGPRLLVGPASSAGPGTATLLDGSDRNPLLPCLAEPHDGRGHAWYLLSAVGRAWEEGVPVDPDALDPKPRLHTSLPSSPFRRGRHWTMPYDPPTAREPGNQAEDPPAPVPPPGAAAPARKPPSPPARDGLEGLVRRITALWADALGLADVSADDDFTALGGDSLLALEVAEALGSTLDRTLSPDLLLNSRTPRGLAEALLPRVPARSGSASRSAESDRSLALLATRRRAAPAGAVPLFLVHPVGGSSLVFRDLAEALSPTAPLYGFTARSLSAGETPVADLSAMARAYADELIETCPPGPFWLGGSSFGGVVAHEMSRLLELRHRPPAGTLLLDSPWPAWVTEDEASPSSHAQQVRHLPAGVRSRVLRARLAHVTALRLYVPPPRTGRSVYIRAAVRADDSRPHEEGWRSVLPHLTVDVSPGGHESMLASPHSEVLARRIARLLLSRE
ncbi:type I polyketide synthase [Streptomyces filamentosus]|uniref:type I polyketide synthase n=1 Tax=Streptomyces filamentosus TaxID=67294 RepID=UPI0037D029C8